MPTFSAPPSPPSAAMWPGWLGAKLKRRTLCRTHRPGCMPSCSDRTSRTRMRCSIQQPATSRSMNSSIAPAHRSGTSPQRRNPPPAACPALKIQSWLAKNGLSSSKPSPGSPRSAGTSCCSVLSKACRTRRFPDACPYHARRWKSDSIAQSGCSMQPDRRTTAMDTRSCQCRVTAVLRPIKS